MLKTRLFNYSDACTLFKRNILVANTVATDAKILVQLNLNIK